MAPRRKKRRQLTPEERRARLTHAHEQLQTAVESLTASEGWHNMLAARSWLRRYSLNNLLLISVQRPDATDVRPLRKWNDAGRHVRKGEKAIKILAPCRYRVTNDEEDSNTDPRFEVRGFTLVSVFDVAQTDGAPLPRSSIVPDELRGVGPDELWTRVAALINQRGYSIERGDCGTAYGWVRFDTRTVRVRETVDAAQAVKTLTHELAHIWCEHDTRALTRPRREIEAESVACLVSTVMGLDTLPYSVPYVAHWARDADTARASAERVTTAADEITAALQERASTVAA